jgi:hypothetical protein
VRCVRLHVLIENARACGCDECFDAIADAGWAMLLHQTPGEHREC